MAEAMAFEVKICGLSTAPTLDAALAAGADMVGLVFFAKSPRHVDLDTAAALAARARSGAQTGMAQIVALTVDADDATLDAIAATVQPDVLQLHGRETPARVAALRARTGRAVWKAMGIAGPEDLAALAAYDGIADRLLLDAKAPKDAALPGGNGVPFDWRLLAGLDLSTPFMLSGGLTPQNVAQALRLTGAPAVDVSSGVESAPGVKDPALISAFVHAARSAAQDHAARAAARDAIPAGLPAQQTSPVS